MRKARWYTIEKKGLRINGQIRVDAVRLVDDENRQVGVVRTEEAISKAREAGLDLVEVAPTSDPPVCRIMDYGKWLYAQKRRVRESHKKAARHVTTLKEIRLRPETDKHDLEIKVGHAKDFLQKGHKVQFTLMFRGRQMLHKEMGVEMLGQISKTLEDIAKVEQPPKMAGRRMTLTMITK